jgi:flagellar hook-associated protein 3 FlgL
MRIPTSVAFERIAASLRTNTQRLTSAEEKLSTGKRIAHPSDDPAALSQILHDRVSLRAAAQFRRNIEASKTCLERIDRVVSASQETLTELRQIVTRVAGGEEPCGPESAAAGLAENICGQLLALANSSFAENHLFSGLATDRRAFDTQTCAYEGDDGIRSIVLDDGAVLSVSVPGSYAFGIPAMVGPVVSLSDGSNAHYISHADASVTVEIRTADDSTVLESFSFSNALQLCRNAADAILSGDKRKAEALLAPLEEARSRMASVRTEVGVRLVRLHTQDEMLESRHATVSSLISRVEDADPSETAAELAEAERALQAVRESATKIISKSLFDFLR